MRAALRPLRLPGFPQLSLAYLVNELGNWLGEIALAVLVFDQTGSPLATAGLFLAMRFAPALLAPPLVARLDPLPIRRTLPALYGLEAAAFAALALAAGEFLLAVVIPLAIADGMLAVSARALTRAAAGASLSPAGMVREGNALLNFGFTAGAAAGPALGGLLVAGAGVQAALLADAASFLCVAALLASARRLPHAAPEAAGWLERLRNSLRYVRDRVVVRRLLAAQAAAFVFFALVLPIEVVFAKETLGTGDAGYGALLASWGAGMVLGGIAFAALRRLALPLLLALSTLAIGFAYLGTAASPTLAVACAAATLGGLGNGVQWVAVVSAIQELTAPSFHARVIALLESVGAAMPGLGFVLGGAVTAAVSPRASYAVAGLGVLAVLLIAIAALRRASWPQAPVVEPEAVPAPAPRAIPEDAVRGRSPGVAG